MEMPRRDAVRARRETGAEHGVSFSDVFPPGGPDGPGPDAESLSKGGGAAGDGGGARSPACRGRGRVCCDEELFVRKDWDGPREAGVCVERGSAGMRGFSCRR